MLFLPLVRLNFGRLLWLSWGGMRYRGGWARGAPHGRGRLRYPSGALYEGGFAHGAKDGRGRLVHPSGFSYDGAWQRGVMTGEASIRYRNGDRYDGGVRGGLREGAGRLVQRAPQLEVAGLWEGDALIGACRVEGDGWRFEGVMLDRSGAGEGQILRADGTAYRGRVTGFQPMGRGALTRGDGTLIVGDWQGFARVDGATLTDGEGIVWQGTFIDEQPHGLMRVRLPNGSTYEGSWAHGVRQRVLASRLRHRPGQAEGLRLH